MRQAIKTLALPMLFAIAFVMILVLATEEHHKEQRKAQEHPRIVVIDSCEYILTSSTFGKDEYTHKANCKNHIP